MDFINEGIALGLDLLILGLCAREYVAYKQNIKLLKNAETVSINKDLKDYVAKQEDKKIPYAVIRGTVRPLGVPLRSVMAPAVTGVVQIMKLNEHRVARGFAGFWTEQRKLIHVSSNEMPFELVNNDAAVEVVDALTAPILDMDIIYDNYEASKLSFFDHILGFFTGVREKGMQTTEEVLREGSFITAIGEMELEGNTLRIQPSSTGPLLLTTASKGTLIKKFEDAKNSVLVKVIICGTISVVLVGYMLRKFYLRKKQERDERKIREQLESERRLRRAKYRPTEVATDQLCVVCSMNPKEIIILPCGHVCICEDCSEKIRETCPVCRSQIGSKSAAFIV
ncbi:mitochondrial E3 ubiquitin protein ligase 1 [Teleopsis dalmanni]|uniref:mitochondrial E3 ubiquitin protein ligase 1 n=1 Tax=Teleopsis dalmanni TaxID=139649 RepID=UPI0018CD2239|nr:mitochondrial E3 ubiquitin protein ligase 1 [Teleopsis dalmanni]